MDIEKWKENMFVCVRPVILLLLLLLINFLDLSSSSSSSSQYATRPRSRPSREIEDYSVLEDTTTESPSSSSTTSEVTELCNYSMCVEYQKTCKELAEGCLCPGLESVLPPSPPIILNLTQQGDKGVVVYWCAPTSIVTHYKVLVKGKDRVMNREIQVEEKKRATVWQDVAAGALVCVVAVNKIGNSSETCATFEPQHSDSGLALKLGIIGGVVGLIVLLILALLLWRHKKRRESSARNETRRVL